MVYLSFFSTHVYIGFSKVVLNNQELAHVLWHVDSMYSSLIFLVCSLCSLFVLEKIKSLVVICDWFVISERFWDLVSSLYSQFFIVKYLFYRILQKLMGFYFVWNHSLFCSPHRSYRNWNILSLSHCFLIFILICVS